MFLYKFDFLWLYENKNCVLQVAGSDQWGNITAGIELIRKKLDKEAYGMVMPLVTDSTGKKFGKTEGGNIWLNPEYTSPYKFYQFWLNVSDEDAKKYIKIFTTLDETEINDLIAEQDANPHLRPIQKRLAKEVTIMVHSEADYNLALEASNILFGNATSETLKKLDENTFLSVFEGVPQFEISKEEINNGIKILDLLSEKTSIFSSKGEARKMIQANGFSINKDKFTNNDATIDSSFLLNDKFILAQKGKKNYFLIIAK